MTGRPYTQRLPALGLSIERLTAAVPADGFFYLMRTGERVGRFRSLASAQEAWREVVRLEGWSPPPKALDAARVLNGEQAARWARNRKGIPPLKHFY